MTEKRTDHEIQAGKQAHAYLSKNCCVCDTETTGLGCEDEIIELCIVDCGGKVLLDTRIKPTKQVPPEATAIHGISNADLADAPSWPDIVDSVRQILADHPVIAFNAEFDQRLLRQTSRAHSLDTDWIDEISIECAMRLAVLAYGSTNRPGARSLKSSLEAAGLVWRGPAHTARADTLATYDLLLCWANGYDKLPPLNLAI